MNILILALQNLLAFHLDFLNEPFVSVKYVR